MVVMPMCSYYIFDGFGGFYSYLPEISQSRRLGLVVWSAGVDDKPLI
jgi:hypothetical protein